MRSLPPKPHVDSATRLAALFPAEKSSKAKALILALKTVTAGFNCIAREELRFLSTAQQEVAATRVQYNAVVLDHQRLSQEIEVSFLVAMTY